MLKIIESDIWPAAIPSQFIQNNQIERAQSIINITLGNRIQNRKILDFGCGDGYCTQLMSRISNISYGYDIKQNQNWDQFEKTNNLIYTNCIDTIIQKAPYDYVLLYDVLDHLKDDQELINVLITLKTLIEKFGVIYIRCHPWVSRHAVHGDLNKAYAHYFLPEETMEKYNINKCRKILNPLRYYNKIFNDNGLIIRKCEIVSTPVELFFQYKELINKIMTHWENVKQSTIYSMMEISFIDYELTI